MTIALAPLVALIAVTLSPLVALIAGILILIVPRLLNFIVAIYLIVTGLAVIAWISWFLTGQLLRPLRAAAEAVRRVGPQNLGQRVAMTGAPDELKRLHRGIREALRAGIARQGATLRDYRTPDGASGRMQHEFRVYGRAGEPCFRCRAPIEKTRLGGRGTWFCRYCQV